MFSVIIPLFNKVGQIKDAVNSVLAQSNADFELIVVDDGSTDGSYDVLTSFTDPRILTIRQKNGGVSHARNTGIAQASGEYICFLDADDLAEKRKFVIENMAKSHMVVLHQKVGE